MIQASACYVRDVGDHYELVLIAGDTSVTAIVTIGQIANLAQDSTNILGKIIRGSRTSETVKSLNGQAGKSIQKVYRTTTVNSRSSVNGKAAASL